MKVKESSSLLNKKKNALPSSKLIKPKKFKHSLKNSGEGIIKPLKNKVKLSWSTRLNVDIQHDNNVLTKQEKSSKGTTISKNSIGTKEKAASRSNSPKISDDSVTESKKKNISTLFDFVTSQGEKGKGKDHRQESPSGKQKTINSKKKLSLKRKVEEDQNNVKEISVSDTCRPNLKENITQKKNKKEKLVHKDLKISLCKEELKKSPVNKLSSNISQKKKKQEKSILLHSKSNLEVLKKFSPNKLPSEVSSVKIKENDMTEIDECKLKENQVTNVAKGLLTLIGESSSSKPEMLDVGEPVFLQVECIKIPICPTKQLRFKLPHPLVDETSDVLLVTADLKGHKIFPDKAVEHYEELLAKLDIKFINKVMPLRMIKKEYSQFEMRRKLIDQFDMILADSRIIKSLPSVLGKFALYKRKMPIPVNMTIGEHKLKKHLQESLGKTQMTVKSHGHTSVVQIGHTKMSAGDLAANAVAVAKAMESLYPGGWRNVRSLVMKTAKSTALPVYMSLLTPNEVKIPVEVRRRPAPVEGELSTFPGHNVVVTHDGNVILKRVEEDIKIDDSRDDEILAEAEKYAESSKTVRYDDSSDEEKEEKEEDSDDEGEAITEAMEQKLMNKYERNAEKNKEKGGEGEEEEEEEEEDDDEEEEEEMSEVAPLTGKKRKSPGSKKPSGPPAKKAFGSAGKKEKNKASKSSDSKKTASLVVKLQTRGTRGGKKNKMSKDQRKALIKRKKAGKK